MKLLIAVVKNEDAEELVSGLVAKGYRATKLASTGGFLGVGNTTFLIGIEEGAVEDVLGIIRRCCRTRERYMTQGTYEFMPMGAQRPVEVTVGGATVFVLGVVQFNTFCQTVKGQAQ